MSQDRVDQLIARLYGQNHLRHGLKQLCDAGKLVHHQDIKRRKNKIKCNNLGKPNKVGGGGIGKRKKKKRKCRDDETENDQCVINHSSNNSSNSTSVHSSKNVFQPTHGNRRKSQNVNNNGNSKICDRDDCNNKKNNNKKRPPKKNNNHSKFNNQSISNSKQKSNHKVRTTKISLKDINVTTLRIDDIDHDIVEMTNGSDEFNENDDYEEFVGGQMANLVDEGYFDEN